MKLFTGFEYLLIDVANAFGLDKEIYEDRIEWAKDHLHELEDLADKADDYFLYRKSTMAIREAMAGKPSGHLVGFDSVCSGMQIMSALVGCLIGAEATGLVNPNKRSDAYTQCLDLMRVYLPNLPDEERKAIKLAVMTSLYGSIAEPEKLFGEGTEELKAFKKALYKLAPGACELLEDLRNSWDSDALYHSWKLPDGFDAKVKVMEEKEARISVDELGGASFTYLYKENEAKNKGVSNIANVIHSVDAYLVRSIERRCNYDKAMLNVAHDVLLTESLRREIGKVEVISIKPSEQFEYYLEQYERSTVADVVILPYLDYTNVRLLSDEHLEKLLDITTDMTMYEPFPVITVHDEFKCHANNMNYLRYQYKEILADLADSELLQDLMSQLYKQPGRVKKMSPNLGDRIRKSNYAIC